MFFKYNKDGPKDHQSKPAIFTECFSQEFFWVVLLPTSLIYTSGSDVEKSYWKLVGTHVGRTSGKIFSIIRPGQLGAGIFYLHLCSGIPTTIKTMGFNITTIAEP